MSYSIVFIFVAYMGQTVYGQQACECAYVNVKPVDLCEFAELDPLYSQVSSTATEGLSIDGVCYTDSFYECDVIDVAMTITFRNGSISTAFLVQEEYEPGIYLISGDVDYFDFILGEPCKNTFVIYRCFYDRLPCPTGVDGVIVIIESAEQYVPRRCIDRGIQIAERQFPGIRFYNLPRQQNDNCFEY